MYVLIFPEVTINRLREKVREYEDKIEDTAKVCTLGDCERKSSLIISKINLV
jgi:hypothetical protein